MGTIEPESRASGTSADLEVLVEKLRRDFLEWMQGERDKNGVVADVHSRPEV